LLDHDLASLGNYITQPLIIPQGQNQEQGHHGVDFAYYRRDGVGEHIEGTEIQSVLDGAVAGLGYANVYGNYIIIETPFGRLPAAAITDYELEAGQSLYLLYAHLQESAPFAVGDPVACADPLGLVGDSGDPYFVTDPHLHLETRAGAPGQILGPMNFYSTQASEAEKAEYIRWRSSGEFALLDPLVLLGLDPELK
jgi:murein DD-endopeptidase MepM/ murein hydrolase activator NlpD